MKGVLRREYQGSPSGYLTRQDDAQDGTHRVQGKQWGRGSSPWMWLIAWYDSKKRMHIPHVGEDYRACMIQSYCQ